MNTRRIPRSRHAAAAVLFVAFMLMASVGSAWAQSSAIAPCLPMAGPAYLDGHNVERTSVVVFVHGILTAC